MDSLTQFALGACVARATAPRIASPQLLLWGGVLATLPDLDALLIRGDPLTLISQHRSWSHSLLMMALATPLFAAALGWLRSFSPLGFAHRCLLVYAVFVTHALLDSLTVYGTQLLWPLDRTPFAASVVFIIDPLYTLPLVVATVLALRRRHRPRAGLRAICLGLLVSTVYLVGAAAAKRHVNGVTDQWRERLALEPDVPVLTVPMPFNMVLWRVLIMTPQHYHEGLVGLFDAGRSPPPRRFERNSAPPLGPQGLINLQRVAQFSGPFHRLVAVDGAVVAEDLRMGLDPDYVFRFQLQGTGGQSRQRVDTLPANTSLARISGMWDRMWDPTAAPP